VRIGFAIDNRACIGCHACTVACKAEHDVPIGVNRTWVKYIEKGEFPDTRRSFNVQRCNHCEDAPCVEICPVTSLFTRPDGIVDFDSDRCIGCKACMQACPYDAIYLDPETLTAAKCNYCTHRVDAGFEPACVVVCPVEAIVSGDLDDPNSRLAQLDRQQRVQYPKPEKGTRPKLFYIGGETAAIDPAAAPPREEYLWSADRGVSPATLALADEEADEHARARRVYDVNRKPAPWGWMVSAYITTKAVAAGVTLVSLVLYLLSAARGAMPAAAAVVSLLLLGATGVLLVADLKQPRRFLYVLLRPQWKSWLVRGAYVISGYGLLLVVLGLMSAFGAPRLAQQVVAWPTALLAAGTAMYTALLFAQAKGRDYWQNPLLVVAMLADALVCGAAVAGLFGLAGWDGGMSASVARLWLGVGVAGLSILLLAEFGPVHQTQNAARTADLILRGPYRALLGLGVVGIGLVAPAVLLSPAFGGLGLGLAAVLLIAGIAVKNHILVQAPQAIPLS
jgi:Fe-S-cluster-containing dehydrogenase component/formate-dependent nitrite reductase membrane component NrfD